MFPPNAPENKALLSGFLRDNDGKYPLNKVLFPWGGGGIGGYP